MRFIERASKAVALLGAFAVAFYLALNLRGGSGLWEGLAANNNGAQNGTAGVTPYLAPDATAQASACNRHTPSSRRDANAAARSGEKRDRAAGVPCR